MKEYPKRIKRQLRELASLAHEREMRIHLEKLAEAFSQWQSGDLGTWPLVELIHEFHDGPNRQLFVRYTREQYGRQAQIQEHAVTAAGFFRVRV